MCKAFGHVSELLKGFGCRLTPSGCALRVPEAERGRVPCDGAEDVCKMHALQAVDSAEPAKDGGGDSPPPLPVRYAGIAHPSSVLTNLRLSDLYRERKDGVLRRDIGNTERCERHKTGLAEPAKG